MKPAALLLAICLPALPCVAAQGLDPSESQAPKHAEHGLAGDDTQTLGDSYERPRHAAQEKPKRERLPVYANGWQVWRRDGVLPMGLPHGGLVDVGQFGLEWRSSSTTWEGMRDGREDLSSQDLFDAGYSLAGTKLTENRLELDFLYGLAPQWILFATVPLIDRELTYDLAGGGSARSTSSGLGDIILGGRYAAHADEQHLLQYTLALGLPTGDYNQRGSYAGNTDAVLPYPLQLGTGTVDLYPGLTYLHARKRWTLGVRSEARIRLGRNSDQWAVSDSFRADIWASRTLTDALTGDVRLQANWWGDFHGDAPDLDKDRSPLENASRQGGSLVQVVFGLAADFSDSYAGRNRLGIEVGLPIDERLDGPGLSRQISLLLSWRLGL